MCEVCRVSGRNIFPEAGMSHDVNEDFADVESAASDTWYVWRRSDGFVGISNLDPHDIFTTEYAYYLLLVTTQADDAYYEATLARSVS